jgi:predicted nucleotidyltransferase
MTRADVLKTIRPLAPELKRLGLGKLYLFGSVARDEPETNDVDLLYEAENEEALDFFDLADAADRLEALLGRPVDLVERKRLHRRIRPRVEAELVEIY